MYACICCGISRKDILSLIDNSIRQTSIRSLLLQFIRYFNEIHSLFVVSFVRFRYLIFLYFHCIILQLLVQDELYNLWYDHCNDLFQCNFNPLIVNFISRLLYSSIDSNWATSERSMNNEFRDIPRLEKENSLSGLIWSASVDHNRCRLK